MKNQLKNEGFTLIELLLVITILGILAAIAIPRLYPQTEKARVGEALSILGAIRQGQEAYFLRKGSYANCPARCLSQSGFNDCWENNLGMEHPTCSSTYFNYATFPVGNGFQAVATRIPDDLPNYGGSWIILDETGTYSGTHPLGPNPD